MIDELGAWAATTPSRHTYTPILPLGGAVSRVAPEATAFGRRDMPYVLELDSMWASPEDAEQHQLDLASVVRAPALLGRLAVPELPGSRRGG